MVVIEVKMVTGWVPVEDTVETLMNLSEGGIKRYEIQDSQLNLYMDRLTSTKICWTFDVDQQIRVSAPKPAWVKIYDYYETGLITKTLYKLKTICGTKEEIPFGNTNNRQPDISQRRVNTRPDISQTRVDMMQRRVDPLMAQDVMDPAINTTTKPTTKMAAVQTTAASPSCPLCVSKLPQNFRGTVCDSQHVLKTTIHDANNNNVKVNADLRSKVKVTIQKDVTYTMEGSCDCPQITGKGKVLVVSKERFEPDSGNMDINGQVVVIKIGAGVEKQIRRYAAKCA